jgi:GNAT superfamily N-acetyltransferase
MGRMTDPRRDRGFRVRPAEPDDADAIARLVTGIGYPTGAEEMRSRLTAILSRPDNHTAVALAEEEVVGFIGMQVAFGYERSDPHVRILAMSTDPLHRGRGVGAALIVEAERFARSHQAGMLVVNSGLDREATHRFYAGRGFQRLSFGFYRAVGAGDPPSDRATDR